MKMKRSDVEKLVNGVTASRGKVEKSTGGKYAVEINIDRDAEVIREMKSQMAMKAWSMRGRFFH